MISVGRVIQHVQKSKEVQSHPEAYFHRSESLLFRQVELKEKKQKQKVTFGWKGTGHRDRKGVKNSKLGHAVKHDEVDDDGIG